MSSPHGVCRVCERDFEVRFRYQVREEAGSFVYVCSMVCQQRLLSGAVDAERAGNHHDGHGPAASEPGCVCDVCARSFQLEYPFQAAVTDG